MSSLRPHLLVLDGMFLAVLGCSNSGTPIPGPGGGGCVEAGSPISYALCSADAGADAGDAGCATSCTEPCKQYAGYSCSENGVDGSVAYATCVHIQCAGGRRPHGLGMPRAAGVGLEAWLAEMAWMEAASVHAFVRLACELEHHGAPRWLVRGAKTAARDEPRHCRPMRPPAGSR